MFPSNHQQKWIMHYNFPELNPSHTTRKWFCISISSTLNPQQYYWKYLQITILWGILKNSLWVFIIYTCTCKQNEPVCGRHTCQCCDIFVEVGILKWSQPDLMVFSHVSFSVRASWAGIPWVKLVVSQYLNIQFVSV